MGQTILQHVSAPVGGINATDLLDSMPDIYCRELVNWFPRGGALVRRPVIDALVSTSASDLINSFIIYRSQAGTEHCLYSTIDGKIYNSGTLLVSGLATNEPWFSLNFRDGAGNSYVVMANGTDNVKHWNGAALTNAGLTGVTGGYNTLRVPTSYKERLFFTQREKTEIWYTTSAKALPTAAMSSFDVGAYLTRGGYPLWIGSWSGNTGNGMDDLFIVCSTQGEVLAYQGTDPASATTWAMVGRYFLPAPINITSFVPRNSDIWIITYEGIYALSNIINTGQAVQQEALTAKISDLFQDLTREATTIFGVVHTHESMFIVGIDARETVKYSETELTKGAYYFLVMNTTNGAWTKFKFREAIDNADAPYAGAIFNGRFVFSTKGDNRVYHMLRFGELISPNTTGSQDYNGFDIFTHIQTSFNYLGNSSNMKRFISVKPIMTTFEQTVLFSSEVDSEAEYDVSFPDTNTYDQVDTEAIFRTMPELSLTKWGKSVSFSLYTTNSILNNQITGFKFLYEQGGFI